MAALVINASPVTAKEDLCNAVLAINTTAKGLLPSIRY